MEHDPTAAVATLSRVLKIDRSNALAWIHRAVAQEQKNDLSRALADFTIACRLQPKSSQAWLYRGRLLSKLDRHAEALDSLKKATELAPEDVEIKQQFQVAQNRFHNQQAPKRSQVVEQNSTEPAPNESASEFALFPTDLNDADSTKPSTDSNVSDATVFVEEDRPAQESVSEFAEFPSFEELPPSNVADARASDTLPSPSLDFPLSLIHI